VRLAKDKTMVSFNSRYPIGIDIGNSNIYAAQLREDKQGLMVRGLVHREYHSETDGILESKDILIPLLKDLVKAKGLRGKRVVVHLPPQYILNFPISFEVGKEESTETAILRYSRQYLTFPIEEAIIDYPSLTPVSRDDGNRFRANIIAARKDQMVEYLSVLKQAGLSVEVVDFGVSSLIRLHSYPHKTIQDPIILCNLGCAQSLFSVVTQDSILVQRHAPCGVQTLLKNLQANLELSNSDKARLLLKKYGLFYEDCLECQIDNPDDVKDMYRAIYQIINPLIEELVHELHKVIGYARSGELDASIEGIYIYGQGTSVRHLDRYLEKRLNITTRLMNPLHKVALSNEGILPDLSEGGSFGMALGLAMRKVTWL
jgi:type IV pilus assembly protein PilM